MSNKHWERADRAETTFALGGRAWDALWYLLGISGGSAAMTWLFSQIEPVRAYGWAATVVAGIGLSCVIAFGLSAVMFGANAAAAAYRRLRPLAAPPPPQPYAVAAAPPNAAADDLARRVAALEREFGEARSLFDRARRAVEDNSAAVAEFGSSMRAAVADATAGLRKEVDEANAAIQVTADAMREENASRFEMIRKTAEHALEQAEQKRAALESGIETTRKETGAGMVRLRERIEALENGVAALDSRENGRYEATRDYLADRFHKLDRRLEEIASQIGNLREHVDRKFLVRDVDAALHELAEPIAQLYKRVLRAEEEVYRDAHTWRFDVSELQSKLERFWDIVNIWESPSPRPSFPKRQELLYVSRNDYAAVDARPGPAVPDDFSDQQLWRWVYVVAVRHREQSEKALERIRREARAF